MQDISLRGAGILCEQPFIPGTVVRLLLVNASHTTALNVDFEVVRCHRSASGAYFVGGRFAKPLAHDELVPFLV